MKNITIKIPNKQKDYQILIGSGLINKISIILNIKKYSKVFVVTDKNLEAILSKKLIQDLPSNTDYIVLPVGEKEKNISNVQKIWMQMYKTKCDRKCLVINLGGGVINDIGGFVASTYMRGVKFVNIPTTLLAQVDASVGGKLGFDFAGVKNLIGTFDQPIAVIIDIDTLSSLPNREFLSGFAEIIKHGAIKDKKYFDKVTSKHPLKFTKDELTDIITSSVQIKADIVEGDETENATRKILNFGHTVGHAVESLSLETQTPLLHGEAISIGMMAEARISFLLKTLSVNDLKFIERSLVNAGLPISIPNMKTKAIIKKMHSDKKNVGGRINFTLLQKIGSAIINQTVPPTIIKQALNEAIN